MATREAAQREPGEVFRTPPSNISHDSVERPTHQRITALAEQLSKSDEEQAALRAEVRSLREQLDSAHAAQLPRDLDDAAANAAGIQPPAATVQPKLTYVAAYAAGTQPSDSAWTTVTRQGEGLDAPKFSGERKPGALDVKTWLRQTESWQVLLNIPERVKVAYESRKMTPFEQRYTVTEQELLAVIHALRTWRC